MVGLFAFCVIVGDAWAWPGASDGFAGAPSHAKVEGRAVPGSRVRLTLDPPARPGSQFLWVQTAGPSIGLEGQTGPELKLTVPPGGQSLGFVLVVNDDQVLRTYRFDLPSAEPPPAEQPALQPSTETLRADAGDDTIGLVGRRVTLNGTDSQPKGLLGYRWIQVDGPKEVALEESGCFCSFVPPMAGRYRFALVVAQNQRISPPDFVTVTVGTPPTAALPTLPTLPGSPSSPALPQLPGSPAVAPAMMRAVGASAPAATSTFDQALTVALASLDDAPQLATPLAEVFEAAALRMDLYRTHGEISSELSRRLDAVVPSDPARRTRWNSLFFEPLSAQTVASMASLGLDLRAPGSQETPLTRPQKDELRRLFDRTAARLSSTKATR